MPILLLTVHALICVTLVILVLLQHGKGADVGANLSSGASASVFGSHGPASFLVKLTVFLAIGFFLTSLTLGQVTKQTDAQRVIKHLKHA